jgi:hypothetical protein
MAASAIRPEVARTNIVSSAVPPAPVLGIPGVAVEDGLLTVPPLDELDGVAAALGPPDEL